MTYAAAGVDLDERQRTVARYREVAGAAGRPEVLGGIGPFAGLFALGSKYRDPVIVSSTDGVGTKTKIAGLVGRYESLGHDIVANCVNDAFTTGAEPLFFLDYIGSFELASDAKVALVKGIADACAEIGVALLGGETAEMPGVYPPGEFDLVGFIVGAVERDAVINGTKIQAGDRLFALPSNGLHTNGFSLARRALDIAMVEDRAVSDRARLERHEPELGESLADAILRPHVCYASPLKPALGAYQGHGAHHRWRPRRERAAHAAERPRRGDGPVASARAADLPIHAARGRHRDARDVPRVQHGSRHRVRGRAGEHACATKRCAGGNRGR